MKLTNLESNLSTDANEGPLLQGRIFHFTKCLDLFQRDNQEVIAQVWLTEVEEDISRVQFSFATVQKTFVSVQSVLSNIYIFWLISEIFIYGKWFEPQKYQFCCLVWDHQQLQSFSHPDNHTRQTKFI